MAYILFFVYLAFLCWALTKIKFVRNSGLSNSIIIILFLLRITAGIVNGWLSLHYFAASDSLTFQSDGIQEFHLLINNPKEYFLNIFHNTHKSIYSGVLDITDSYWNDLRSNIISKMLSLFNILSASDYYINILFYNFIVFFSSISIYKIYAEIFSTNKILLIFSVFLLPSTLFFTSAIHRDGLVFLGLGIIIYNMYNILKKDGFSIKKSFYVFLGLSLIFLLRSFIFITLIPGIIAWIIAEKRKKFVLQSFVLTYLVFIILFFCSKFFNPKADLPQYVSYRQIAFIALSKKGGSTININPLFPNFRSFFNNTPQALNHSLMRPYLTESKTLFYIPASLEIFIYEVLFVLFLLFPLNLVSNKVFVYFGVVFSLCVFLIIGYTIPIIGAIVRYRSIYFSFLIVPVLFMIDYKRIQQFVHKKNL